MKAYAVLLFFVACTLGSCSKAGGIAGGRHSWTHAGNLRVGLNEEPKNLNPLLSADARGNPVPMLATVVPSMANGGISKDGLTITYHLAPNARWSDGVAVTSDDVAWSWSAIENSANDVV